MSKVSNIVGGEFVTTVIFFIPKFFVFYSFGGVNSRTNNKQSQALKCFINCSVPRLLCLFYIVIMEYFVVKKFKLDLPVFHNYMQYGECNDLVGCISDPSKAILHRPEKKSIKCDKIIYSNIFFLKDFF